MFNIGLNSLGLIPGRIGGAETYFRSLVESLQKIDTCNNYTLLCNASDVDQFELSNANFSVKSINCLPHTLKWYVRGVIRNLLSFDLLNSAIYSFKLDIIHHPFSLLSPSCPKVPSIVTFLDLQHEFHPEFFSKFELAYRNKNYRVSARNAARIIAISNFTKACLVERYGIEETKIDVIYPGCARQFQSACESDRLSEIRGKYGFNKPFIFYPAATWPHKNHLNLLRSLKILVDDYGFDGQLVLTGIPMQTHQELLQKIDSLGLTSSVKVLGYLDFNELPFLYAMARMLVFPSFFEGFGIPLVEAMASGCPVVCSNVASLPEVGGDACKLFSPTSPEDMAHAIWNVWSDESLRQLMRNRGLERVKLFEWEKTARETIEVYQKVAASIACR